MESDIDKLGLKQQKITIYDVAKHAGVSPGTVSRTLNNIGYIKEQTREKVLAAVEELQYVPNVAGRTLKTTKTRMICLAIPDTSNAIYFHMIEAVLETAKRNGYSMLLYYTNGQEAEELHAVRILQERTVDALILVHFSYSKKLRTAIDRCEQPIALCGMCTHMWAKDKMRSFDTLSINVFKGIYDSMSYLIEKGHSNIVYLAGKRGIEVYRERFRGYKQALADNGLEYKSENVFWHSYDEEAGMIAGDYFFERNMIPTAVCASNDLQAIGFYKSFKSYGIRVPEDVMLIGMDNLEVTEMIGVSSINMFEAEVGRKAAELIFLRMKSGFSNLPPQDIQLTPKLVLR